MKKTVVILFGGQSSEHEVSCMSARIIAEAMDKEKYNMLLVGITKEGHWLYVSHINHIVDGTWYKSGRRAVISPDAGMHSLLVFSESEIEGKATASTIAVDVVFPVLHGLYGEDGTVQGLFELAKIPYVGCGVLSSAISMDKLYTKFVVERLGIRQASYVKVERKELFKDLSGAVARVEEALSYPVFVKPSNSGSSRGVSKANNREELVQGMKLAAEHDRRILVEKMIVGREIECAVLGGEKAAVSGVGEILAAAEFYDYDAKYNNAESKTVISPELPEGITEKLQQTAKQIFAAVDGFGLARVDFFVEEGTNEIVFNEINTMPGFTSISMYSMLWEAQGVKKNELIDQLIATAFER